MSDPAEVVQLPQDDQPETPRRRNRKPRDYAAEAARRKELKAGAPRRPQGRRPGRPPRRERDDLEAPIRHLLTMGGTFWHSVELQRYENHPDPTCGAILIDQAPAIAAALNAVAQDDESVYRWLSAMMTGGGWGAVAFAMLPVAQAVVATHALPALQSASERRRARAERMRPEVMFPESVEFPGGREEYEAQANPDAITEPEDERDTWRPPNEIPPE